MKRNLVLLLALTVCPSSSAADGISSYRISWTAETFPDARVEAEIRIVGGEITMFPGLAWAFGDQRGWAANVRNLEITSAGGVPLRVEPADGPVWKVGDGFEGMAKLRYDVDLEFARRNFSTGNEQIAWLRDDALFTTGFALFIYSSMDAPALIEIEVPESWSLATAWRATGERSYLADDTNHLIRNILTIGQGYHLERLSRGEMTVDVALMGSNAEAADLVHETFVPILDYFTALFESDGGHFMFALLPGPNDGEGYMTSFASSQPSPPDEEETLVWANSIAHELFHYWNGSRISSLWEHYPERQWFSEGFTEYYANRALLDTDVITSDRYDEILGHYLSFHLFFAGSGLFDEVTLRNAGSKKGLYRPGVYDSGVAAAFCLDGLIRESTKGERSLDDMMRLMDHRYGRTKIPIVFADIVSAASETAGEDLAPFFAAHVEARDPLPVAQCASQMGYRALVDGYHVYLEREDP